MSLKHVTTDSFQADVLGASKPVLVDFWAEWCGPCRQVAPILEAMATEHGDKLEIVKVNVDNEPQLAAQYGIVSIPTMLVFQNGQPAKSIVGAKPKVALESDLAAFIG